MIFYNRLLMCWIRVVLVVCLSGAVAWNASWLLGRFRVNLVYISLARCTLEQTPERCGDKMLGQLEAISEADDQALRGLGEYFLMTGHTERAAAIFQQLVRRGNNPLVYFRLGQINEAAGDTAGALQTYGQISGVAMRLFYEGKKAWEAGDLAQALAKLQLSTQINPGFGPAQYYLGRVYLRQRRFAEAASALQRAIESGALESRLQLAAAYWARGAALMALQQIDLAQQEYEKAISIAPDFSDAYYRLCIIYRSKGQVQQAESLLRQGIAANPGNIDFEVMLVQFYREEGKVEEAKSYLVGLTQRYPSNAVPFSLLGQLLYEQGDYHAALLALEKAVLLETQIDPYAHFYLGRIYAYRGEYDRSAREYQIAIGTGVANAWFHYNLAQVYLETDRPHLAIAELERALAIDPDLMPAAELLESLQR
mgnify:CR=1 FL=1